MRFKLTLNRTGRERMIPMDYQYFLSSWIYKVIGEADPEFSKFLHTDGYVSGCRKFKLFNYSPLDFGKPRLWKEKCLFEILGDQLSLYVSFYLAEAAEKFIIGLFNNQTAYIGDRFNGLDLIVTRVVRIPEPVLTETMAYRAISAVVVSVKNDTNRYAQYLSPVANQYQDLLRLNLLNKYNAINPDRMLDYFDFEFELKGEPRSKLVTLKANTPGESKLRGFIFDFAITCPVEIHQLILSSGLGEKNSMGFGWVKPI